MSLGIWRDFDEPMKVGFEDWSRRTSPSSRSDARTASMVADQQALTEHVWGKSWLMNAWRGITGSRPFVEMAGESVSRGLSALAS